VIEVSQPKALLDVAFGEKITAAVKASPAYEQAAAQPGFQEFLGVVSHLEAQLGADRKTALAKLLRLLEGRRQDRTGHAVQFPTGARCGGRFCCDQFCRESHSGRH
jgi:hypothetical protein